MIAEMFQACVYLEPSSIYITAMSVMILLITACLAVLESMGKHLQYSKFWNMGSNKSHQILLSSRTGMLFLYTPAFLAGLASFWIFPDGGTRFMMLKFAVTFHFLKRDLEVLFLHKFSGFMVLDSVIIISVSYFTAAASMIYLQHLTLGFREPLVDLKYLGLLLFVVGICGNFYHHYLLSKLREKNEKGYQIPRGGLFSMVICPHYLFEIIVFLGISLISQTPFSYSTAIGIALYLVTRSYATRKWYLSKFENFPKNVKALVPYVF
ncbi:3-oxo-5-alpha-steroid 4-dehydrogenase family protein [Abeliophyllum distichum]|uniref:3-oxo-5-alpha-steroid 4-dehydrogenase family protein n=1 Tax=Abeliophyllum distichum TaxID=126358 RepID=A0ABD1UMX5_9LAMI